MPSKRKRPSTPSLPSFDDRVLHFICAWEEYNGRKPDNDAIFNFLNIRKREGYENLKADSVHALASQSEVNPRVVRFSSVPPPESLESCKNYNSNSTSLQSLNECAGASCHTCHLRHLGIVGTLGEEFASSQHVDISTSQRPFMNIVQHWPSGKVDGRLNVLLYTRAGQAKTSWPIVGVGREVDNRRRSYASVVTEWLRLCREDHPACPSNTDVPLPTRLLDVGSSDSNSIRLRITAGQRGLYTAFSHCWGGGIEIRTTRDSITARQKQILYSNLPKTFQDAVTVTRDLGLRYLWIDALCIIQDDIQDWEEESGNMTAVYQNAYTVLGADMSLDSHNGFLETESGGHNLDQGVLIAAVDSENSMIYARQMWLHSNLCPVFKNGPQEPLSKRAWTMQEQMLASRMIHFATREMIWECNSALLCECMELDGQYSSLAINQKPMLVASRSPDGFRTPAKCSRATPYRAPSWSWASVYVDSSYISPHFRTGGFLNKDTKLSKTYARIVEASCTPKGKDPFGAAADGYVKILAPLLEMILGKYREFLNVCDLTPLGVKPDSRQLTAWLDFKFVPNLDENLFCLFIGELSCGSNGKPCCGLVLRKLWDATEMYERVGCFKLDRGEEVNFIQGVEDSVVVII